MTVSERRTPFKRPPRWARLAILGVPLGIVAGLSTLSLMANFGKATPGACKGSAARIAALDPLVRGDVAAMSLVHDGKSAPMIAFKDAAGEAKNLVDFRGKTVLLNLWATWCVPCRAEMPALDRLAAKLGGPDFQVVAINVDQTKLDRPRKFLADAKIASLAFYADESAKVLQTLGAFGLPTSVLIDRDGCEIGILAGPATWDSPDAESLIRAARGSPAPQG